MSGIAVAKMSGAGNDFVVLDDAAASTIGPGLPEWIRRVTRRGLSLGSDGVLIVTPLGGDRVRVVFHNPDGARAFCGNGSRCAARFAHERGMAAAGMVLETDAGAVPARVVGSQVRLELPPPIDRGPVELQLDAETETGRLIDAGVPHLVVPVADPDRAPLERWAPAWRRDPRFGPDGVNVDLAGAALPIRLRTWERGVEGETLACGSGAVATAFAARLAGAPAAMQLIPASGIPLTVEFAGPAASPSHAVLEGDARWVVVGELSPEALWVADRG